MPVMVYQEKGTPVMVYQESFPLELFDSDLIGCASWNFGTTKCSPSVQYIV